MKSVLDRAIQEHRLVVSALTVRAMDMSNDAAEIRKQLAEADNALKLAILAWAYPPKTPEQAEQDRRDRQWFEDSNR